LATLRCTKTSPGWRPRIVVSGTRESEQPSQTAREDQYASYEGNWEGECARIEGDCEVARSAKKDGFWWVL
jgi:hypothetical protein